VGESAFDWQQITIMRARVLSELEDRQTERRIAERAGIAYSTVRGHVEDLKDVTGCRDVQGVGRWWQRNRGSWLRWVASQGGVPRQEWDER
jgi:DNA-binding CsgD family transcriptional regulator